MMSAFDFYFTAYTALFWAISYLYVTHTVRTCGYHYRYVSMCVSIFFILPIYYYFYVLSDNFERKQIIIFYISLFLLSLTTTLAYMHDGKTFKP